MVRGVLIAAVAIVVLVIAAPVLALISPPTVTKRFTVEAQLRVDGEVLDGRTVWELRLWDQSNAFPPDSPNVRYQVKGEAIPFTASSGETYFLLRRELKASSNPSYGAWIIGCLTGSTTAAIIASLRALEGGCDVSDNDPMVVQASGNEATPKLTLVNGPDANLGVDVLSIKVQVTAEPVTVGIAQRYPWIRSLPPADKGVSFELIFYQKDFTTE